MNLRDSYVRLTHTFRNTPLKICPCEIKENQVWLDFVQGDTLESAFDHILQSNVPSVLVSFVQEYVHRISALADFVPFQVTDSFANVFGIVNLPDGLKSYSYTDIDLIFDNIIVDRNGGWTLIDYEWCFPFPIPLEYVLWRSIRISFEKRGVLKLFQEEIVPMLNLSVDESVYEQMERSFQQWVYQYAYPIETFFCNHQGRIYSLDDLIASTKEKECHSQVFIDKGEGFSEKDSEWFSHSYNHEFDVCIPVIKGMVASRIDPDSKPCFVQVLDCWALTGTEKRPVMYTSNGTEMKDGIVFPHNDAQIVFRQDIANATEIRIRFCVRPIDMETSNQLIECTQENQRLVYAVNQMSEKLDSIQSNRIYKILSRLNLTP